MNRFVVAVLLMSAAGCAPSAKTKPAESGSKTKYTLAVIPKGTTHEFWKSVHAGADQAAKELGNVEILWKGPLQENDREGQINVVQDFITKKVDGIVLAPLDAQALVGPVKDAQAEGIPTVIFDSALNDNDVIVSYVATDNYQSGVLAARRLGELMKATGNDAPRGVMLLRYNPGSESTEQREQGFEETIKKEFPELEVLSSDQYAGTTPEMALDKSQQMLLKYGDRLGGTFLVCEPNATGMLGALEEAGLAGKVKFVGMDPTPQLVQALKDGKMHGLVLQDPVRMGYLAVKAMVDHLEKKTVEKRIPTGEFVATKENMDSPEMVRLLNPAQFSQ